MSREIHTTCNRDCPDSCGVVATVEDGRIIKHGGDPNHGVTRGTLCLRGNHYLRRFYSEERVLHPMRRAPDGGWQRINWDDALDMCAEQLNGCLATSSAESVLVVNYSGIKGLVARMMHRLFWANFGGVTQVEGGTSIEAAVAAQELDLGREGAHAAEDLANSRAVVVWGKNVEVTRPHTMRFISDARRAGAELHVIDPLRCATARKADRHYQIRPGSDPWLALGIGKLLLEAGDYDQAFIEQRVEGFDAYRRLAGSVDLAQVAEATGLPRGEIERLARLYATVKPLATLIGLGPAYWEGAGVAVRLIDALALVSGNVGLSGGGAQTDTFAGYGGMDFSTPPDTPQPRARKLLMPRLGADLLGASDPAIKMGWISGANPAATCPDTGTVDRALASLDFLVVVDQFLTASAAHAHLFLPCTTYLEMDDLVAAYGHHWIGATQRVVDPLGEARSDVQIYQGLASRLGFCEALAGTPESWADRILGPLATSHGITFQRLRGGAMENPLSPGVPFSGGRFPTTSGKASLIGELPGPLFQADLKPGQFHLLATKTLKMVNAQINPEDRPPGPVAMMHPEAMAALDLEQDAVVRVKSDAGEVEVRLGADDTLRGDTLLLNPAAWRGDLQGVNQLRVAGLTDLGKAAAMHGTLVTVEVG